MAPRVVYSRHLLRTPASRLTMLTGNPLERSRANHTFGAETDNIYRLCVLYECAKVGDLSFLAGSFDFPELIFVRRGSTRRESTQSYSNVIITMSNRHQPLDSNILDIKRSRGRPRDRERDSVRTF